jgi:hypothetical protein
VLNGVQPQSERMADVVAAARAAVDGQAPAASATGMCNGYWHGRAGMDWTDAARP